MEQHTGSQYDDDLTVGMDEYDDSLQTGNVDLFEFVSDEESPITRLKTIVLSIDWEITDDILRQFNMELLDLKDIWANEKINLVYIQALEKISKYIYKEKANSNPNAIKLLLNFYSNLEKIVSTESMPAEEKKRLLLEDVEKFEKFKKQISHSPGKTEFKKTIPDGAPFTKTPAFRLDEPLPTDEESEDPLLNLKAIVFGMDWEITEADLIKLGEEVRNLEKRFSNSKAKLIFLQGIGALGAYINLKRSNAHVDAFKLLHSFFLSLENTVRHGLTGEEEKRVLMLEVEKFNAFKSVIASTISPEAIAAEGEPDEEDFALGYPTADDDISPAFADMPEDVHGFQEEEEAESIGYDAKQKVEGQIERFFDAEKTPAKEAGGEARRVEKDRRDLIDEMESRLDGFFGEDSTLQQVGKTNEAVALKGVDVETEADDDAGEEVLLRFGDELAPALSDNFEESRFGEQAQTFADEKLNEIESFVDIEDQADRSGMEISSETQTMVDISVVLQGVEVETEADDDSEEEPLPMEDEELAPALFALDEVTEGEGEVERDLFQEEASLGIEEHLEEFFGDEPEPQPVGEEPVVLQGVDIEIEDEEEVAEGDFLLEDEELAPALFAADAAATEGGAEKDLFREEASLGIEEHLEEFFGDEPEPQPVGEEPVVLQGVDIEIEDEEEVAEGDFLLENEELAPALFAADAAATEGGAERDLFREEASLGIEEHLEEFFGDEPEPQPVGEEPVVLQGVDIEIEDEEEVAEGDFLLEDEELAPALFAAEGEEAQDIIAHVVPQEEIETEVYDSLGVPGREDSVQASSVPAEDVFAELTITDTAGTEVEAQPLAFQDSEQAPVLAGDEESISITLDEAQEIEEHEIPADLEDHLKEFFETGVEELETKEEPEVDFSEVVTEAEMDAGSAPEGTLSFVDEEPETALVPEETEDVLFVAEETEEPVFTAAMPESSDIVSLLQEDEDFIEYIEGVEFDSEEENLETVFEPAGKTEEVVFEAADLESDEQVFFDEVEEELEQYLTEHDEFAGKHGEKKEEHGRDEEYFGAPDIFGESFEIDQGPIGSEIRMEVFPETPKSAEIHISEGRQAFLAEDERLSGEIETGRGEDVYTGARLGSVIDTDPLTPLRNCVASLGLDINDSILRSLFDEINKLNNLWITKPVEKIFLQLLSTVAQHIQDYRHEASPEARSLLMSVFNKLELSRLADGEIMEVQEDLLSETSKILLWQQKMLSRKAMEQGDNLDVVFEEVDEDSKVDELEPTLIFDHDRQDRAVWHEDRGEGEPGREPDAMKEPPADALDAEKISRIVRDELETLRQSFRAEMTELLRQHLDKESPDRNSH